MRKNRKEIRLLPTQILVLGFAGIILVGALLLMLPAASVDGESMGLLNALFESTSAFGTVGLTRGLSPNLSDMGKIIISITMYLGRVGPLTMAFAFSQKQKQPLYKYCEGNIIVG